MHRLSIVRICLNFYVLNFHGESMLEKNYCGTNELTLSWVPLISGIHEYSRCIIYNFWSL